MANERLSDKPTITTLDATTLVTVTTEISGVRRVRQAPTALFKGLDGKSAIATITNTNPANIPAVGQQVQYAVDSSTGFVIDQLVAIGAVSNLKVVNLPTATSILLENVDATAGAVAAGAKIVPSATKGTPGTPGAAGANAFTTVTTQFTIPAVNTSVAATVGSTAFMSDGMALQISGQFFRVASITNATTVSLTNTLASQTGTIAANSKVVVSGEPGAAGANAFTTVTTAFTIPAVNTNVPATVGSTAFMSDGMALQISGKFFRVASITNATTVSLTNTLTSQTGTIAATSKVVAAGEPGPAGAPGSSSGGASGVQFTYLNTAGTPLAGQLRSADIAVSGTVTISATDAQTQGVSDVLPRLKVGAIVDISKDGTNKVRGTISTDYNATSNSFDWTVSGVYGAIANNNTVYLSIFSDAPSVSSGGGGGLTWSESTNTSQSLAINTGVISNTTARQSLTLPSPTLGGAVAVRGKGTGGWQITTAGTIFFPDGSSNGGIRSQISSHRYAGANLLCIDASSNFWVVESPLIGVELFSVGGYAPETLTGIAAVEATGVTLLAGEKNAANTLITTFINQGIFNNLSSLYLFLGGTANSHKINWKNPGTNDITWIGTVTHSASGVAGDGATGRGNTGIDLTQAGQNNHAVAVWAGASSPGAFMGAAVYGNGIEIGNAANTAVSIRSYGNDVIAATPPSGALLISRTTSSEYRFSKNGATTIRAIASQTLSTDFVAKLTVLAREVGGAAQDYSNASLGTAAVWSGGLTLAQGDAATSAIQAFATSLGR